MQAQYRAHLSLLGIALILTVSGCAFGPTFRGSIQPLSNSDIVVVRAVAHQKANGIQIDGDVRRTNGYATRIVGHLHIVGLDAHGNVVAETDAPWGEFMNRRFRLAYFRAILKSADTSAIISIRIEPVIAP